MAPKRKYTNEQLAYLKKYYPKYPTKLVAEQLGIKEPVLRALAQRHGLSKNKRMAKAPLPEFVTPPLNEWEEGKVYSVGTITFDIPFGKPLAQPPRKNWFQRLVSWLLTGRA